MDWVTKSALQWAKQLRHAPGYLRFGTYIVKLGEEWIRYANDLAHIERPR